MALCPSRIAGVAFIRVDGQQYALKGNLTISIDPFIREGIAGMDGVHGYKETPQVPHITFDISDMAGLSLQQLRSFCNSTVTAELGNGKTYLLRGAWTAAIMELNAVDGQVTVNFQGLAGEEILGQ
jgi:hypothetical protein